MGRSEEALRRRAEKRQRSVEEQRIIDQEDINRAQKRTQQRSLKEQQHRTSNFNHTKRQIKEVVNYAESDNNGETQQQRKHHHRQTATTTTANSSSSSSSSSSSNNNNSNCNKEVSDPNPLKEVGAWTCPSCGNQNFASRRWCNSHMCNEPRPSHIPTANYHRPSSHCHQSKSLDKLSHSYYGPQRSKPKTDSRHDEETSKKLIWANQADEATICKNQDLRRRYLESGGKGMEPKDIERAQILLARDERKRQKKRAFQKPAQELLKGVDEEDNKKPNEKNKKKKSEKDISKSQRDKNKALRERYEETGGKGMKLEQIDRAKQLLRREERKNQKRRAADKQTKKEGSQ